MLHNVVSLDQSQTIELIVQISNVDHQGQLQQSNHRLYLSQGMFADKRINNQFRFNLRLLNRLPDGHRNRAKQIRNKNAANKNATRCMCINCKTNTLK